MYQAKLTALAKDKRWKHIPLIHPEMVQSLADIQKQVPRKPLVKTIKAAAPHLPKIGLYSGRKGFTDLMLSLGQSLENVAMWMGHASIERTWRNYKNKDVVNFTEITKKKIG